MKTRIKHVGEIANGRIYSEDVLKRAICEYVEKGNTLFGRLEPKPEFSVDLGGGLI